MTKCCSLQSLSLRFLGSVSPTLIAVILVTLGCGGNATMAPVSGKVTHQGKVVPDGSITFYPKMGGRPSIGQIQPDGSYKLSSVVPGDGAMPGEYTVVIEAKRVTSAIPPRTSFEQELALEGKRRPAAATKIDWLVPEKYSSTETSGLTATVEDKDNVLDFDL